MKKILYLLQIDWDWIFQRPQIFAMMLDKDYDCTIVYPKSLIGQETVVRKNERPKCAKPAYKIPGQSILGCIQSLNDFIARCTIGDINQYDAIWVSHPSVMAYVPDNYQGKVIYDCMDNHVALALEKFKEEYRRVENKFIERADLIFVSSLKLAELVNKPEKTVLIRNGYKEGYVFDVAEPKQKDSYKIGYFGTVAEWFDFPLLEKNLENGANVEYHIIGPGGAASAHRKMIFEGSVEHAKLYDYVKDYDALIMPFQINELILAVDPVKLYEYISFGKCVISVYYPEIERFEPYVYFYRNQEEYDALIKELEAKGFPPKYTEEQKALFLKENSWEYRYKIINEKVDELLK